MESVSEVKCRSLVDRYISNSYLDIIERVQGDIREGLYKRGGVPNCFWNSMRFLGIDMGQTEREEFLSPYAFESLVEKNFVEIPKAKLSAGDLVYFEGELKDREVIMRNNRPVRVWLPYEQVVHGAIYLEDGLIFQKENVFSTVFTIDSLANSHKKYEEGVNANPAKTRGSIKLLWLRGRALPW